MEQVESEQRFSLLSFHPTSRKGLGMTSLVGKPIKLFCCLLFLSLFLSLPSLTPRAQSADATDFFETKIRPLLSAHCLSCHGTQVQMAGLNLSTEASFLKGSEKGPAVVKGDPENSRLIQAVRYLRDIKMPPTGKLTAQQISDLTEWVQLGAPWPNAQTLGSAGKDKKRSGVHRILTSGHSNPSKLRLRLS